MKKIMTGNEAVARGAYEAGVRYASAYPGTPSTEILQNLSQYKEIVSEWAPNEKVALEAVIGASIAGGRTFAAMKHVGVNVAADPLFTFAYQGVNAGSVLITADEPGMHSSQNEQDNRNYAKFAKIPMLEPANSQESKDMMVDAFDLSEEFDSIVLFRMTTRVCHSKSIVEQGERVEKELIPYEKNFNKYVCVPSIARKLRHSVEERTNRLKEYTETSKWNYEVDNNSKIGVIASGMSYEYAWEALGDTVSYLKLGFTNPLPKNLISDFCDKYDKVFIVEENDPYIEEFARVLGKEVIGKDLFPYTGEMTPDVIKKHVLGHELENISLEQELFVPRPPTFCTGCPHRGFFYELGKKRKKIVVAGDIGCYSLAVGEPYNMMDWIICMGASFSSAHGAQKIFDMNPDENRRLVSIMGDSTFFHTGINSLLNTIYNKGNTINIILDNRITGMTGQQDNPGSGKDLQKEVTEIMDIEKIVRASMDIDEFTITGDGKNTQVEILGYIPISTKENLNTAWYMHISQFIGKTHTVRFTSGGQYEDLKKRISRIGSRFVPNEYHPTTIKFKAKNTKVLNNMNLRCGKNAHSFRLVLYLQLIPRQLL